MFAVAEQLGLEGIVSKRLGSRYRSDRTDRWRKIKCFTETAFVIIGTERKDQGPPAALLALPALTVPILPASAPIMPVILAARPRG